MTRRTHEKRVFDWINLAWAVRIPHIRNDPRFHETVMPLREEQEEERREQDERR